MEQMRRYLGQVKIGGKLTYSCIFDAASLAAARREFSSEFGYQPMTGSRITVTLIEKGY